MKKMMIYAQQRDKKITSLEEEVSYLKGCLAYVCQANPEMLRDMEAAGDFLRLSEFGTASEAAVNPDHLRHSFGRASGAHCTPATTTISLLPLRPPMQLTM